MKYVIAPDSFKGSISATGAAEAIAEGIRWKYPCAEIVTVPIADGGEGTLDTLVAGGDMIWKEVTGTDGRKIKANFGVISDTAVIEMARAAGLTLVPCDMRNAETATTYGVGELITAALDLGFRKILLTVGGSGTNDGGCGMAAALGMRFIRTDGKAFVPTGGTLGEIASIDASGMDKRLSECQIRIATDVKNPLTGKGGATFVYARQKGADDEGLLRMENGMVHYAKLLANTFGRDVSGIGGCGAGGGLAAPLLALGHAEILSGIDAVLDAVHFKEKLADADLVITGEGKIDRQSLYGKAISGVARAAAECGVPVICFAGCIGDDKETLMSLGLAGIYAICDYAKAEKEAMENAGMWLSEMARRLL